MEYTFTLTGNMLIILSTLCYIFIFGCALAYLWVILRDARDLHKHATELNKVLIEEAKRREVENE